MVVVFVLVVVVVVVVGGVGSTGGDCAGGGVGGDSNVINVSSGKLLPLTSGQTKSVDEEEKAANTRPSKRRRRRKRRKSNVHTFPLRTHQQTQKKIVTLYPLTDLCSALGTRTTPYRPVLCTCCCVGTAPQHRNQNWRSTACSSSPGRQDLSRWKEHKLLELLIKP